MKPEKINLITAIIQLVTAIILLLQGFSHQAKELAPPRVAGFLLRVSISHLIK